jgi:DNA-binding CsgD family transcriptional regulator
MARLNTGALFRLVDLIYAATIDATQWVEVAAKLNAAYHATYSTIFGLDTGRSRILFAHANGLDEETMRRYDAHYAALDIRRPGGLALPSGTVMVDEMMIDRQSYLRSPIYNEFLAPRDVHHLLCVMPARTPRKAIVVSVNRSATIGGYSSVEMRFMERLTTHLICATRISAKLAECGSLGCLSAELMERFNFGIFTVGPRADLVHANRIGRALLTDGTALTLVEGKLAAVEPATNRTLQLALASCINCSEHALPERTQLAVHRGANLTPLRLIVCPLSSQAVMDFGAGSAAIIFAFGVDGKFCLDSSILRELFGFTDAESRVAEHLLNGLRIAQIAASTRTSEGTIRTHLKKIFAKTYCTSQAQLIRALLLSPAVLIRQSSPTAC